jgi:hypothetical protein
MTFLHPRLRTFVLEHMSSFVIDFRHRLTIPQHVPRRVWALLEMACCVRAALMLAAVFVFGSYEWTRLTELPPDSLYARTVFPSYWSVLRELRHDARLAAAGQRARPQSRRLGRA